MANKRAFSIFGSVFFAAITCHAQSVPDDDHEVLLETETVVVALTSQQHYTVSTYGVNTVYVECPVGEGQQYAIRNKPTALIEHTDRETVSRILKDRRPVIERNSPDLIADFGLAYTIQIAKNGTLRAAFSDSQERSILRQWLEDPDFDYGLPYKRPFLLHDIAQMTERLCLGQS
jgi:hypothetical protein